jgi:hypothetical protein
VKDHIRALKCGGPDVVSNMQWQTTTDSGRAVRSRGTRALRSHRGEVSKGRGNNPLRGRHEAEGELDPVKRAALFIAMNDMVVEQGVVIPVVCRPQVSAISKKLRATLSGWDSNFWNLKDWYREV